MDPAVIEHFFEKLKKEHMSGGAEGDELARTALEDGSASLYCDLFVEGSQSLKTNCEILNILGFLLFVSKFETEKKTPHLWSPELVQSVMNFIYNTTESEHERDILHSGLYFLGNYLCESTQTYKMVVKAERFKWFLKHILSKVTNKETHPYSKEHIFDFFQSLASSKKKAFPDALAGFVVNTLVSSFVETKGNSEPISVYLSRVLEWEKSRTVSYMTLEFYKFLLSTSNGSDPCSEILTTYVKNKDLTQSQCREIALRMTCAWNDLSAISRVVRAQPNIFSPGLVSKLTVPTTGEEDDVELEDAQHALLVLFNHHGANKFLPLFESCFPTYLEEEVYPFLGSVVDEGFVTEFDKVLGTLETAFWNLPRGLQQVKKMIQRL